VWSGGVKTDGDGVKRRWLSPSCAPGNRRDKEKRAAEARARRSGSGRCVGECPAGPRGRVFSTKEKCGQVRDMSTRMGGRLDDEARRRRGRGRSTRERPTRRGGARSPPIAARGTIQSCLCACGGRAECPALESQGRESEGRCGSRVESNREPRPTRNEGAPRQSGGWGCLSSGTLSTKRKSRELDADPPLVLCSVGVRTWVRIQGR